MFSVLLAKLYYYKNEMIIFLNTGWPRSIRHIKLLIRNF